MIPLAMASEGEIVKIISVRGGRSVMQRLADLGLIPGTSIKIIKSMGNGPLLLEVKGSRIALGRGISMKLFVEVM